MLGSVDIDSSHGALPNTRNPPSSLYLHPQCLDGDSVALLS